MRENEKAETRNTKLEFRKSYFVIAFFISMLSIPLAQGESLQTFSSEHYTIHTNLGRDEVADFYWHMDQVFANYQKRFGEFRSRRSKPMPLYLLRTQDQYVNFMGEHDINARNSGGMFFVQANISGLATWTSQRSRSQTFAVLQHEGFHQFAWNYLGRELPVWLNEGLAQYFEDGVMIHKSMTLALGNADRIERVRQAIDAGQVLPIDDVLDISHEQWSQTLRTNPEKSALLYAQSWSITYFLINGDNGRYQQALARYLKLVSDGRKSAKAFRTAFGTEDLSPMEKRWRKFAARHKPDPITTAITRLEFFGAALLFMHERDEKIPRNFDALKNNMRKRHFSLKRSSTGVTITLSAEDESLFGFNRASGSPGRFVLLEAARNDLPPRISAVGLRPEPTLVWSRSETDELIQDIEFR